MPNKINLASRQNILSKYFLLNDCPLVPSPLLVTLIFEKKGFGDERDNLFLSQNLQRAASNKKRATRDNLFLSQNLRTRPSPVASGNPPCFPREIQQQQQKREATLKEGAEVQSPIL